MATIAEILRRRRFRQAPLTLAEARAVRSFQEAARFKSAEVNDLNETTAEGIDFAMSNDLKTNRE